MPRFLGRVLRRRGGWSGDLGRGRLLKRAAGTRFGRAHGFAGIGDVAAYQAATAGAV